MSIMTILFIAFVAALIMRDHEKRIREGVREELAVLRENNLDDDDDDEFDATVRAILRGEKQEAEEFGGPGIWFHGHWWPNATSYWVFALLFVAPILSMPLAFSGNRTLGLIWSIGFFGSWFAAVVFRFALMLRHGRDWSGKPREVQP